MVIWITGKAGAGKTVVSQKLSRSVQDAVLLDGDKMREHFAADFTDDGRKENIMRLAHFAAILEDQGFTPIVACVSPKREWREEARKLFKESILIYLSGGTLWEGTTYEEPDAEEMSL